jgi:hypothetical protein
MNLRFKTKIDIFQTSLLTIELIAILVVGLIVIAKNAYISRNMMIVGIIMVLLSAIQIMRVVKRFEVYDEALVIKRPLSMTSKTDTIFKINQIKEIVFRNITGRFGGPVIIVYSSVMDETYRINFPKNSIDEFVSQLNELGIKTVRDNI